MKHLLLFPLALLCLAPLYAPAQALSVRAKTIQPPEMGWLSYLELQYGREAFSLVPPRDWPMRADGPAGRVSFAARTGTVSVVVQFSTNDARGVLASTDALLLSAAPNLSGARVLEEFPVFAGDTSGRAVDVGFVLLGRAMRCRAAGVTVPGGCVTFVLTCGAEEFKAAQPVCSAMLTSFQRTRSSADVKR